MIPYNKKLVSNAQILRKNMTPEEKHLWYDFLKRLPLNVRRQHNIENYIVDFYIAEKRIFPEGFLTSLVEIHFREIASVRKIEQRAHVCLGEMGRRFDFDLGRLIGHDRLRIAYADPIVVYFHRKVADERARGESQKNQNARLEQPAVHG